MIRLAIISGSQRPRSESARIARHIEAILSNSFARVSTFLRDLGEDPLPACWSEDPCPADKSYKKWVAVSRQLQNCDGLVVVSPEWGGMVPPSLKNFFLWCNEQELSHKPGLIVAVAGQHGGAYPVAELRMSSYKNTRICYIPEQVIIRNVQEVFREPGSLGSEDGDLGDRLHYGLTLLLQYAVALRSVRDDMALERGQRRWGM